MAAPATGEAMPMWPSSPCGPPPSRNCSKNNGLSASPMRPRSEFFIASRQATRVAIPQATAMAACASTVAVKRPCAQVWLQNLGFKPNVCAMLS